MFDFHRFMLYNIFFYALKRLFENVVIAKSVPKLRIVLTIIKPKSEDYFQFFMFRTVLNNRRYIFRFEGIRKGKPKTFR